MPKPSSTLIVVTFARYRSGYATTSICVGTALSNNVTVTPSADVNPRYIASQRVQLSTVIAENYVMPEKFPLAWQRRAPFAGR